MSDDDLTMFADGMVGIIMNSGERIGKNGQRFRERYAVLAEVRSGFSRVSLERFAGAGIGVTRDRRPGGRRSTRRG